MNYVVKKNADIAYLLAGIGKDIKKSVLLSGSWTEQYAVAGIVFDNVKPNAEVHEHTSDVWYVVKGTGTFTLGGVMHEQTVSKPGEIVADAIIGGEVYEVKGGDMIDVPPGVPHQIDARGSRLEMIIVKVNEK